MDITLTKEFLGEETEADLVEWSVQDGQSVVKGDGLCQLETSKTVNEFTSPASGTITLKVQEGDVVELGDVIAVIE